MRLMSERRLNHTVSTVKFRENAVDVGKLLATSNQHEKLLEGRKRKQAGSVTNVKEKMKRISKAEKGS